MLLTNVTNFNFTISRKEYIFSLSLSLYLEFASHFFNQPPPPPPLQRVKKRNKIVPDKIKMNINSLGIPAARVRDGLAEIIIFPTSIKFILAFINKHDVESTQILAVGSPSAERAVKGGWKYPCRSESPPTPPCRALNFSKPAPPTLRGYFRGRRRVYPGFRAFLSKRKSFTRREKKRKRIFRRISSVRAKSN